MPRKNPIPAHEVEICRRIRAVRKGTGIARSVFALGLKVDEATLSRVENLRAPLKYELYKGIDTHFPINTRWLRTGDGNPIGGASIDDSAFAKHIRKGALFSEVYDKFIKPLEDSGFQLSGDKLKRIMRAFEAAPDLLDEKLITVELAERWLQFRDSLVSGVKFIRAVNTHLRMPHNSGLTETESGYRTADVTLQLPNLRERLKRATEKAGKKSELAKALRPKVPLASVSRWISGEREPGGEVTLQLLKWVEQQGF